jgi:phenylpropionate dioxygenase-like ring-hydroxylating dioxygenase large terminal subunit
MAGHAAQMHQIRLSLCRRAVEHARKGSTDTAPGTMYNDVSVYTDPERHALELRKLFHEMPQVVCLSVDLPQPGSFRLFDDLGVPIVVQRGMDGVVRAFLNICPHRGARLVREGEGCAKRHTCRFHGWTFDTQGRAGTVPQEKHFFGPIADHKQLVEVPAAERHGLVFVQATPGSTMDLDAHLGAFGAELDMLDLDHAERVREADLHAGCNWKYALDTYFENYHFATLHKDSIGPLFVNNLILHDTWGPHHRVVFPPRETWEWTKKPESEWLIDTLGTPYFIFPNTIVYNGSLRPESAYLTLFRIYPRGVGELVTCTAIYAPGGARSETHRREVHEALTGILALVQNEDYDVTSESWKNFLALPKGSRVVYGRQELAVQHVHRWFARALGVPEPEVFAADDGADPMRLRA